MRQRRQEATRKQARPKQDGAASRVGAVDGRAAAGAAGAAGRGGRAWLIAGLLSLPFFLFVLTRCLTLDFWYDEIFTLEQFVFVPLGTTIGDYSAPNNHVFFNLLNRLYVSLTGLTDIFGAMDQPWILRIPPLVYATLTLAMVFRIARRSGGDAAGYTAVAVLAATVPFFNFAAQVRGYSLSMLLLCVMIDRLFCVEETPRVRYALAASAAGALALYTIPSNLYFLSSIGAFYTAVAAAQAVTARRGGFPRALINRYLLAAAATAVAVGLAAMLYLPMLQGVMHNEYVQAEKMVRPDTLTVLMPRMWLYLVSGRWLLLPAVAAAAALAVRGRAGHAALRRRWAFCVVLLVLPFMVSSLRGDHPPDRVFVNVAPVFALLVALSVGLAWGLLPRRRDLAIAGLGLLVLYNYGMLRISLHGIDGRLLADIEQGHKSQDSFYGYYQAYYAPSRVAAMLLELYSARPGPVYVYEYGDNAALFLYLKGTGLPCMGIGRIDEIRVERDGVAYVVTAWPRRCRQQIAAAGLDLDCRLLTEEPCFQGVLLCRPAQVDATKPP